jgi:hypothetical protein
MRPWGEWLTNLSILFCAGLLGGLWLGERRAGKAAPAMAEKSESRSARRREKRRK